MLLEKQPEQTFYFLDRNLVEEFNSPDILRQILGSTMTKMQPDIVTEYYERLDGLLVAMYFKNPPGRLIRNQWTHPVTCFPDFSDWNKFVNNNDIAINKDNLVDINNDCLGVLR